MQVSSFWPPRAAYHRFAAEGYQRRNPEVPWLPKAAIETLPDLLKPTDRFLEYGSGKSTAWLAKRVGKLVSVEHDKAWFDRVQGQLSANGLDRDSVRLLSLDPSDRPAESPYVRAIDEFAGGELDVCLVDGEYRVACMREAIARLASGGMLLLDDAHGVLDHPTTAPHARYGRGPADRDWAELAEQLSGWRMTWISDGYSDCAIWFKP
jgi:predicted O-methyltransferase YrrM